MATSKGGAGANSTPTPLLKLDGVSSLRSTAPRVPLLWLWEGKLVSQVAVARFTSNWLTARRLVIHISISPKLGGLASFDRRLDGQPSDSEF
eukprot:Skav222785  [mRNA]  locus=scaffold1254:38935:39410:+ [translate_table: standard]